MLAIPCLFLLPESPRWLASNNKIDEAQSILLEGMLIVISHSQSKVIVFLHSDFEVAKWNGKSISTRDNETMIKVLKQIHIRSSEVDHGHLRYKDMFQKSNARTTVLLLLFWSTGLIVNKTLLFNSTKLHGNLFLNYICASALTDLPGIFILTITMKYFDRRLNLFATLTILAFSTAVLAFIPKNVSTL